MTDKRRTYGTFFITDIFAQSTCSRRIFQPILPQAARMTKRSPQPRIQDARTGVCRMRLDRRTDDTFRVMWLYSDMHMLSTFDLALDNGRRNAEASQVFSKKARDAKNEITVIKGRRIPGRRCSSLSPLPTYVGYSSRVLLF